MSWLKFNLTNIGPAMARPAGPVPTPLGGRDQSKKKTSGHYFSVTS